MLILAKLIAVIIFTIGAVFIINPALIKSFIEFARVGKRYYIGGIIRLVFGAVYLLAASRSKCPWLIFAFGILFIIVGILIFALGEQKIKQILNWLYEKPLSKLRFMAIIPIVIGLVLIFSL